MTEQFIQVHERAIAIYNFDNEKYVAIKPICEAIGVNYSTQLEKIEKDEILSSVVPLRGIVGADKKTREMRVIPLRYVFGWLFTINPKNVNPDIKEKVFKYRMECYNALYDTFTKRTGILRQKAEIQTKLHKLEEEIKADER